MTQDHPITPSPELVEIWYAEAEDPSQDVIAEVAIKAARWGADMELEACCEYIKKRWFAAAPQCRIAELRAARRPEPPSLKEQALDELHISFDRGYLKEGAADIIRRALEALPDD
jgi:hypothetical protein